MSHPIIPCKSHKSLAFKIPKFLEHEAPQCLSSLEAWLNMNVQVPLSLGIEVERDKWAVMEVETAPEKGG